MVALMDVESLLDRSLSPLSDRRVHNALLLRLRDRTAGCRLLCTSAFATGNEEQNDNQLAGLLALAQYLQSFLVFLSLPRARWLVLALNAIDLPYTGVWVARKALLLATPPRCVRCT